MGLIINKPKRVLGMDIPGLYLRMKIDHYFTGVLDVYVNVYANKEAYQENINNTFQIEGILRHYQFPYDRETDGVDVLQFVHDKITQELTLEITEEVTVIDLEGEPVKTKEGEPVKETVVVKAKFVSEDKIVSDLKIVK